MTENISGKNHNLILENRRKLVLTGVRDVDSFNENEVIVFTELGEIKMKGKNLQIINVSTENGDLEMTGTIESILYGNNIERVPNNFITKLFK